MTVEFFDDYTQVAHQQVAEESQAALEWWIEVLGWQLAKEDKKRKPVSKHCVSLGVELQLDQSTSGIVKFSNKPGRIEEIFNNALNQRKFN